MERGYDGFTRSVTVTYVLAEVDAVLLGLLRGNRLRLFNLYLLDAFHQVREGARSRRVGLTVLANLQAVDVFVFAGGHFTIGRQAVVVSQEINLFARRYKDWTFVEPCAVAAVKT